MTNALRALPSVDRLLHDERIAALVERHSRGLVVDVAREVLAEVRSRLQSGVDSNHLDLVTAIANRLELSSRSTLRRTINATGVVIHTNLGRAPLSEAAMTAMRDVALGYSNLEYDLDAGSRGSRHEHVRDLLTRLSGAEDALVVNNNAAAVLLVLIAVAAGHEVIISRGELVEIGGGFRIPDVLSQSGAELVEVGTTNRTYVGDFEQAVSERTVCYLRVHSSNYRVIGFVSTPTLGVLADSAHRRGLLLVDDLGSGSFLDTSRYGLMPEPVVQESVAAGVDLVCFSGDKLLGGPQAGIIVGRSSLIARLKKHPLTRAIRPDKTTLAGLGATLGHYVRDEAERAIPVWRMISARLDELEARGRAVIAKLGTTGAGFAILDGQSAIGGGSLPGETLPTRLVAAPAHMNAAVAAAALRALPLPVVARVERDRLVVDPRTVLPEEDDLLVDALRRVVHACAS